MSALNDVIELQVIIFLIIRYAAPIKSASTLISPMQPGIIPKNMFFIERNTGICSPL